jgi:hypothetical protein
MMKKKEGKEKKKNGYVKPTLTKHKKLKDITADKSRRASPLGCTKFF